MLYELQNGYVALLTPHLLSLLEPLAHRQNVVNLSLFYSYYFGRCSWELAQLIPLLYSAGRSKRFLFFK